ncbi:MAG: hypothetical protein ABGY28_05030, partial [bacterium]
LEPGEGERLAYRDVPGLNAFFHVSGAPGGSSGKEARFEHDTFNRASSSPMVFTPTIPADPLLDEGSVRALTWGGGKDRFLWAQRYKKACSVDADCGNNEICNINDVCKVTGLGGQVVVHHRLFEVDPDGSASMLLAEMDHKTRGMAFGRLVGGGTGNSDFLRNSCRTDCFDWGCYDRVVDENPDSNGEICDDGGLCDGGDRAGYTCDSQSECGAGSCEPSDCQQYEPICEVVFTLVNPEVYTPSGEHLEFEVTYASGLGSFGSVVDCTELVPANGSYNVTAPSAAMEKLHVDLAATTSFGGSAQVARCVFNGAVTPTQGNCLTDTQPLPEFTITEQGQPVPYVVVSSVTCTQPDPANCRNQCRATATCGDNVLDPGEACEDGNDNQTDGCRNCQFPTCGDSVPDPGEECDRGGETDFCTADCIIKCGNGEPDAGEECDDGNADHGNGNSDTEPDACRTTCKLPSCGDQVIDTAFCNGGTADGLSCSIPDECPGGECGEQCDDVDGNGNDASSCRAGCKLHTCGDGITDNDEQCDNGAANSDTAPDACRTDCTDPRCGDGVLDEGEGCDDGAGNSYNGGCIPVKCCLAGCGDGHLRTDITDPWNPEYEQCDDGDADNSDDCTERCEDARCGDGHTQQFDGYYEECDDGNGENLDACNNSCKIPECIPSASNDSDCDGIDDDCDGSVDEDFEGQPTSCGIGECAATGSTYCENGSVKNSCTVGQSSVDDSTCNGLDDDCDGSTDEDYASESTSCGVGACAASGSTSCEAGVVADSCTAGSAAADDLTCDGVDDDCNGQVDDGFAGEETRCGVGACESAGLEACVDGSVRTGCEPRNPESSSDNTCDGIDDDCDGVADEDFTGQATS